ncbi:hypothetical protein PVAND_007513 [Polypedilum vanderplanki]|uniref:NADPH:adrenodoxin oxidoreductase, mitochondrial n=1 Tax=Polypedilum vanderplanki TaxID=319348 RepID=A0A9J6C811_POLVA|nr:hypothetical protein PVAND_007513 [Polypedilum vanderplanki]
MLSRKFLTKNLINSCLFSTNTVVKNALRACIVGSGPSGFYSSQYLLKHLPDCRIDLIEKLPVPFGLVRYGVAPDHPEVKNVINTFSKTAENPNFNFYGNISLGKDVSLNELRQLYDVVVLCYGSDVDSPLGIKGEDIKNVISAREFVGWYNGLPHLENFNPDLSGEEAILIGQGNVAIDVARILLTPIDILSKTDITEYALEALSRSKIKKVYLVGRRGPLQAAFTIAELREMLKLPNTDTYWRQTDFEGIPEKIDSLPRPRKRITELMVKSLNEAKQSSNNKKFLPVFFRSPTQFIGNDKVESVEFSINILENESAVATDKSESLQTQLVCRSIGYKSISVDASINFDDKLGRVINKEGRVLKKNSNEVDVGLYVAGWLGTGPSGVILTTMNNAFKISHTIIDDFRNGIIKCDTNKTGIDPRNYPCITWTDWLKIDKEETERGHKVNKPREKIVSIKEMLSIV